LTDFGKGMAKLPLDPTYAALLLKSQEFGCVAEVLTTVAMLSSDNIFVYPHREKDKAQASNAHKLFSSPDGDLLTLVTVYRHWMKVNQSPQWCTHNFLSHRSLSHAQNIRKQLIAIINSNGLGIDTERSCLPNKEPFLRCLAAGLFLQVARRTSSIDVKPHLAHKQRDRRPTYNKDDDSRAPYRTLRGGLAVYVHPSSFFFGSRNLPEYVTYAELLTTSKQYMRNVTAVDKAWLSPAAPHVFKDIEYQKPS
jgi:HrpA-like RNA helicase